MKQLYKLKNKKTGEILPENHFDYMSSLVSPYGAVYAHDQFEDKHGELVDCLAEVSHMEPVTDGLLEEANQKLKHIQYLLDSYIKLENLPELIKKALDGKFEEEAK